MNTTKPHFPARIGLPSALTIVAAFFCAIAATPLAQAEIIGIESFEYADGSIAGKSGGLFWDWSENTATPAHTGTPSDWNDVAAAPAVSGGKLLTTANSSAKREFNGPGEGVTAPSEERDGAFNGDDVIYFRTTMTREEGATWSGLSSYDFGAERIFFGVPGAANPDSGEREFGVQLHAPFSGTTYSGIAPVDGQTYTLIAKLDFLNNKLSLWVDPGFGSDEADSAPAVTADYTGTNWSTAVRLGSGGTGTTAWNTLRVATTWEEITPGVFLTSPDDSGGLTITGYDLDGDENEDSIVGPLVIPANIGGKPVTAIGVGAFELSSELTSVTLPDSVKSIGDYSFGFCSDLTSVTLPDGLKSIGGSAFADCSALTSVTLPDGLESIGHYSFADCSALTAVTLPGSLESIGEGVFAGCNSLTAIGVTDGNVNYSSDDGVLYDPNRTTLLQFPCGKASSAFSIPLGVTSIGDGAFGGCEGLRSLTLPDGLKSIGDSAFWGCSDLTSVNLPDGLESIGSSAFMSCSGLTSVTLPDSVRSIGERTFAGCEGLRSLTMPDGLESIGDSAFSFCNSLTSVTLPAALTSLGKAAFWGCRGLTAVYFLGNAPSVVGDDVFSGVAAGVNAYYVQGATGFSAGFGGLPPALWDPAVQTVADLGLSIRVTAPERAQLRWDSTPGESFDVFHSTDLNTWTKIATIDADNAGTGTVYEVDVDTESRFYRLQRR